MSVLKETDFIAECVSDVEADMEAVHVVVPDSVNDGCGENESVAEAVTVVVSSGDPVSLESDRFVRVFTFDLESESDGLAEPVILGL